MHQKTASELVKLYKNQEFFAEDLVKSLLQRIESFDSSISALLQVFDKESLNFAKKLDQKRANGEKLGRLAGVPIIIKDNIHMKGTKTTCASRFLENYTAPFHATVVKYILEEDGIILAKANLDEFAMGSSTEHSAFMQTKNPHNLTCTPGGSSGGSAAAVAAGFTPLSLGSDTGGSIRQPAAFCGLYGFKPTYGRVSRYGLVAFGSSLDQIGPFARSVEDIALMQDVIARPCNQDSTCLTTPLSKTHTSCLNDPIEGKTLGFSPEMLQNLDKSICDAFYETLEVYKSLGVKIQEVSLPSIEYSVSIYYILSTAEASTNLARFDGIRYGKRASDAKTLEDVYEMSKGDGYGNEVKQRILLGTYVLSAGYQDAYYTKAQKARTLIINDYKRIFETCDAFLLPTTASTAFKLGSIQDPVKMYMQDMYTISANLAGIPALSFPVGLDKENKPIGLQLQGPILRDKDVLNFAYHYEKTAGTKSFVANLETV